MFIIFIIFGLIFFFCVMGGLIYCRNNLVVVFVLLEMLVILFVFEFIVFALFFDDILCLLLGFMLLCIATTESVLGLLFLVNSFNKQLYFL